MFDDEYFFSEVLQICPYCFVLPVSLATMLPLTLATFTYMCHMSGS